MENQMYELLSAFTGGVIAIMVIFNGQLTAVCGTYPAAAVIHGTGLAFTLLILAVKREKPFKKTGLPLWLYLGGAVGFGTTVFNNTAFGKISVSAIMALCLMGQSISSIAADQWGLFGMEKRKFHVKRLWGIGISLCGTAILLYQMEGTFFPAAASLLSGITIVVSRCMNGGLTKVISPMQSTFLNYVTGLAVSVAVLLLIGNGGQTMAGGAAGGSPEIYLGGILGVFVVLFSNLAVMKISAFHMTLFSFLGQMFTGIAADSILKGQFLLQNFWGGSFVALGLFLDLYLQHQSKSKAVR